MEKEGHAEKGWDVSREAAASGEAAAKEGTVGTVGNVESAEDAISRGVVRKGESAVIVKVMAHSDSSLNGRDVDSPNDVVRRSKGAAFGRIEGSSLWWKELWAMSAVWKGKRRRTVWRMGSLAWR
ncbi:MAG: hypothetical protein Q9226_003771 [Calogaya cf. arnoldii]